MSQKCEISALLFLQRALFFSSARYFFCLQRNSSYTRYHFSIHIFITLKLHIWVTGTLRVTWALCSHMVDGQPDGGLLDLADGLP